MEWTGEQQKEVREDQTRTLTMNGMDQQDFDDNDKFGDTHILSLSEASEGGESDEDEHSSTMSTSSEDDTSDRQSRRGSRNHVDKRNKNAPTKHRPKGSEAEEPFEDLSPVSSW